MRKHIAAQSLLVVIATSALTPLVSEVHAKSSYGPWVDAACRAFNGTEPYAEQSCGLCHTSNLSERVDPQWMYWEDQTLTEFCPDVVNTPPNGTIDLPTANESIMVGDSLRFEGTAVDPDGDTQLSFLWDFGGGAANAIVEDPGDVVFNQAGTFNVVFTVTDSLGVNDPTPDSRTVRVAALPPSCTDQDSDGFAVEGASCGEVDCNDADPAVNPAAAESCSDGIDNNCNGLIDIDDPVAVGCPATGVCTDEDGDGFNQEGGFCGVVDCDDGDAAVTVQCLQDEACRTEAACLDELFPPSPGDAEFRIEEAQWDDEELKLEVEGDRAPAGETVRVYNASTGALLGTTTVETNGEWSLEQRNPATVPCRVRVEIARQSAEREVEDAPQNCDDTGGPSVEFRIENAQWDDEDMRLTVKGDRAPAGNTVLVYNANTDDLIGTTTVRADGEWRFVQRNAATVPCRVRVEIRGQSAERDVEDAPRNCDASQPGDALTGVEVEAEWEKDRSRLKAKGEKFPPGAKVELFNAETGKRLGAVSVESDGEWRVRLVLKAAPCRLRVEVGGKSLTEPVSSAPECR